MVSRKERFSNDCFRKFVSQKQRKQMMSDPYFQDIFKVMYQDRFRTSKEADLQNMQSTVLVPLSFGSSSLVMLDVLNDTLTEQKTTQRGKTGFQVDLIICYQTTEEKEAFKELAHNIINTRYASNKEKFKFHLIDLDSFFSSSKDCLRVVALDARGATAIKANYSVEPSNSYNLKDLLNQCTDRTTREDILSFIRRHLIKKFASQHEQRAIMWGHSMTKLADETISLIVKGRGSEIAASMDCSKFDEDYNSSFKNLFPMKDILLSEIDAFCLVAKLDEFLYDYKPQDTLLIQKVQIINDTKYSTLVKNMTVNEIARKYFDDIEGDYSNVISTVVKTANKLAEPQSLLIEKERSKKCVLCFSNIYTNGFKWLSDITINEGVPIEDDAEREIFNEWKNSTIGNKTEGYNRATELVTAHSCDVPVCYGCIIIFNRIKERRLTWPTKSKSELEGVLDECVLTDDES